MKKIALISTLITIFFISCIMVIKVVKLQPGMYIQSLRRISIYTVKMLIIKWDGMMDLKWARQKKNILTDYWGRSGNLHKICLC